MRVGSRPLHKQQFVITQPSNHLGLSPYCFNSQNKAAPYAIEHRAGSHNPLASLSGVLSFSPSSPPTSIDTFFTT